MKRSIHYALLLFILFSHASAQDKGELRKDYKAKKAVLKDSKDADQWSALGDWARENKLKNEAVFAYKRAESFADEHAGAVAGMKKLGWVLENGVWNSARTLYSKKKRRVAPNDLDARYDLAAWALDHGMTREWEKDLKTVLKLNPYHCNTRTALGYKYAYGEWWTEEDLEKEKQIDVAFETALKEKKSAAEVFAAAKDAGYKGKLKEVERVLNFQEAPRGTHKDKKLEYQSDKFNGEYTYGVPRSYKPWRKNAMIVFLHGGGPNVGDGDEYFPQIWPYAQPRGYITVCPTVMEKVSLAWNNERHVEYIRAIVHEMRQTYNIDPDRIHLMGHSMGGFGTFYVGTRTTDLFCTVSPWSGGPNGALLQKLKNTPTYIVHGKDDSVVGVGGSRRAAQQLKQMKYPHVYIEITGHDHAIPPDEWKKGVEWLGSYRLNPQAKGGR